MPLFVICHHPDEPGENLQRFNQAVRTRVVEAAKELGEFPEKLTGGTTKDMFGTVFHVDPFSEVDTGELELRGYFNPREDSAKDTYVEAVETAAKDSGFGCQLYWSVTPIVDVTIWDIYPDDTASVPETGST